MLGSGEILLKTGEHGGFSQASCVHGGEPMYTALTLHL